MTAGGLVGMTKKGGWIPADFRALIIGYAFTPTLSLEWRRIYLMSSLIVKTYTGGDDEIPTYCEAMRPNPFGLVQDMFRERSGCATGFFALGTNPSPLDDNLITALPGH
jgi:hypothetical protein